MMVKSRKGTASTVAMPVRVTIADLDHVLISVFMGMGILFFVAGVQRRYRFLLKRFYEVSSLRVRCG